MPFLKNAVIVVGVAVAAIAVLVVVNGWNVIEFSPDTIRTAQPVLTAEEKALGGSYRKTNEGWIYTQVFKAKGGKSKGIVFAMHGWAEHCNRQGYKNLFDSFTTAGYTVYSHDHIGHGRSDGDRAYNPRFQTYVDDAYNYHSSVLADDRSGATTTFLFAHSMGSIVALQLVRQHPEIYSSLILSGTCTYVDPNIAKPAVVAVGTWLAQYLPKFPIQSLDDTTLTFNDTARAVYSLDPLNYRGKMRARWANQFLMTATDITSHFKDIKIPYLAVHGGSDGICNLEGAKRMESDSGSEDKTLRVYNGGGHELFEDSTHAGGVFKEIVGWMQRRTYVPPK